MIAPIRLLRAVQRWLTTVRVLVGSGMIAPMRPDKYVRQGLVIRRHGANAMSGIGLSAVRAPRATALVDERGSLTWAELDRRVDAAGTALAGLLRVEEGTIGILCRNHRGLVESLAAATRIGADALLLNTGFSGPQLRDVLEREGATVVVYDEEFAPFLAQAKETRSTPTRTCTGSTYSSRSISAGVRTSRPDRAGPCC